MTSNNITNKIEPEPAYYAGLPDILESLKHEDYLWDLFSRKEEYNARIKDSYERFPYHLSESRNIFDPSVSKFLIKKGMNFEYPDGKKFAVCLTHDIDFINPSGLGLIAEAARSLRSYRLADALKVPLLRINKKWNPYINFKTIMDLEELYEAKSSFYFLSLKKEDLDYNYDLENLRSEMGSILDRGNEIGLHGGHSASYNLEILKNEKKRLEHVIGMKIIGYRSHYLRFRVPETWELLKEAGFKYDTTFGYPNCVGFRNGMCHPYKPFDRNENRYIDILEIPLIIMDETLFEHMKLNNNGSFEMIKRIIDIGASCKGVITILFHNFYPNRKHIKLYKKTLEYCDARGAHFSSAESIYAWWKKNNYDEY